MMKKIVCLLLFCGMLPAAAGSAFAQEESDIKKGFRTLITNIVTAGKEALSGVNEGVESGRQTGESIDGAKLVANKDDLAAMVQVSVLTVKNLGDQQVEVTLAVRNDNEFPVRLTNLSDIRSVVLLDTDGFSYVLPNPQLQGTDVTALAKASTRVRYLFSKVEGKPAVFRLFDTDFKLP